jgi:hypothetical protein
MPRGSNHIEWTSNADECDHTAKTVLRDVDIGNPFDDPEVRRRMAEVIAQSARKSTKSDR